MSELWNLISNSTTWTRLAGLVWLLVRLFPLLSPAHDGNEAHCEDILANGGGGFFFSVRWAFPDGTWASKVARELLQVRQASSLWSSTLCGLSASVEGVRVLDMVSLDDTIEQQSQKE